MMSQSTHPQRDDDELTIEESWRIIAEEYEGEPAGEIARLQLDSLTEDTN